MHKKYLLIILLNIIPSVCFSQETPSIIAPNNNGIITQGQNGNNYIYQKQKNLPDGIYQNDQLIGKYGAIKKISNDKYYISNININSSFFYPFEPIEINNIKMSCPFITSDPLYSRFTASTYNIMGGGGPCDVVKK